MPIVWKLTQPHPFKGMTLGQMKHRKTIIQLISKHMSFTSATLLAFKEFKSVKSSQMTAN